MTISIGNYRVNNIKYFEDHEGFTIFKCDILHNDKKIGTFSEDYMCGPNNYTFDNNFNEELLKLRKTAANFFDKYLAGLRGDDKPFGVHPMLGQILHIDPAELADAHVFCDERLVDVLENHSVEQLAAEMRTRGRDGDSPFMLREDGLVILVVLRGNL